MNIEKVKKWQKAVKALAKAKAEEIELRNELINEVFPERTLGTNYRDINDAERLQAVFSLTYRLDPEDVTQKALDKIIARTPEGKFITDRLVKWDPCLYTSEYKLLRPEDKKIIDEVLTVTEAQPTLKVVPRKDK